MLREFIITYGSWRFDISQGIGNAGAIARSTQKDLIPQIIMNEMPHSAIICLLFFFSGFAGLAFEIVWCRQLLRALGSGLSANSCVFAAFLTGAATGALICWRLSAQKPPAEKPQFFLVLYGRLELIAAISGLAVCLLLNARSEEFIASCLGLLSKNDLLINIARFFIAFLLLLIPCACMGASYAALGRAFSRKDSTRLFFPLLYGANTIGAAAGSLCSSFFILPFCGLTQTALCASGINFAIFLLCELMSTRKLDTNEVPIRKIPQEIDQATQSNLWAMCAFASGFIALVLEIIWSRIFSSMFGSSIYSVGTVLFMVLLGGGGGSLVTHFIAKDRRTAGILVANLFALSAISIIASTYCHGYLQEIILRADEALSAQNIYDPFTRSVLSRFLIATILVLPSSAFVGSILPAAAAAAQADRTGYGSKYYAINCLGGVSACIIFGAFFFKMLVTSISVPLLASLLISGGLCILTALLLLFKERVAFTNSPSQTPRQKKLATYSWLAAVISCTLAPPLVMLKPPSWNAKLISSGWALYNPQHAASSHLFSLEMDEPVFYMEGLNSTVTISQFPYNNSISIKSDAKVEATLPIDPTLICPGSDLSTHVLLASLPVLFHAGNAEKGLLIGLGSGTTASALLSFPELKQLRISEIEAAVKIACAQLNQYNGGALAASNPASKRVEFEPNDARFVLSSSQNDYDVIISQPGDPWVAGSANLFTHEFFELAKSRLQDKGIFCQWLQIYSIPSDQLISQIATFNQVFPSSYICHPPGGGELLLLGFKNADADSLQHLDSHFFSTANQRIKQSRQSNKLSARAGLFDSYDALSMVLLGPEELKYLLMRQKAEINKDDSAKLEFATCKNFLENRYILQNNFLFLIGQMQNSLLWTPELKDDAENNMYKQSKAFARQALQDGSPLGIFNQKRALETAEKLSKINESTSTLYNRGVILKAFGKDNEANTLLASASAMVAKDQSDVISKFDMSFEADKLQECSQIIAQLNPNKVETRFRRAMLDLRLGQPAKAVPVFRELQSDNALYLPCILSSAYASAALHEFNEAENFLAEYLSINPWDYNSQLAYTSVLCRSNKLTKASAHALTCMRLKPDETDAFLLVLDAAINSSNKNMVSMTHRMLKLHAKADSIAFQALALSPADKSFTSPQERAQFSNFAHLVRTKAEDPNNGYKVLGEP